MTTPVRVPRRSRRHRVRIRVTTCLGTWFTVNVGRGGFCAELTRALPVGGWVEGLIHLKGGDVSFAGRVAWAEDGDSRLNRPGRMGVCFLRIDPDLARGLAGWEDQAGASPA
jgi:hypothetical protein